MRTLVCVFDWFGFHYYFHGKILAVFIENDSVGYSFVLRSYSNTITQTSSLFICQSPLQTCFQPSLSPPPLHTPIWIFSNDFFKVSSGQFKGSIPRSHRILSLYHVRGHRFYGTTSKPWIVSCRTSQVWRFSVQSLWFFGLLFPVLILCVSGLHLGWRPALHNWPLAQERRRGAGAPLTNGEYSRAEQPATNPCWVFNFGCRLHFFCFNIKFVMCLSLSLCWSAKSPHHSDQSPNKFLRLL